MIELLKMDGTDPMQDGTSWAQPLIAFRWFQPMPPERQKVLQQQWAVQDGSHSRLEWREVETIYETKPE